MIKRTMDAAFLNVVVNHPDVRPWVGGSGPLDVSSIIQDPNNVALVTETGGFILTKQDQHRYELHTQFLPEGRGPAMLDAAREGLRYMFAATDCLEIVTKVAASNRPAALLARHVGFDPIFTRDAAWPEPGGSLSAVTYYCLTFDRWRARDLEIAGRGHWFHEQLETAKQAAASELPIHPDDEAHDRAVGAAVLMALAGNATKAVWTYNRWAALAGYVPISLLSKMPPVIDLVDAVVEIRDGEMEVLTCR